MKRVGGIKRPCCVGLTTRVVTGGVRSLPDGHIKAQKRTIVKWEVGLYT